MMNGVFVCKKFLSKMRQLILYFLVLLCFMLFIVGFLCNFKQYERKKFKVFKLVKFFWRIYFNERGGEFFYASFIHYITEKDYFHSFFQPQNYKSKQIKFSSRTKNKKQTLGKSSDKMFSFDQGHTKDIWFQIYYSGKI